MQGEAYDGAPFVFDVWMSARFRRLNVCLFRFVSTMYIDVSNPISTLHVAFPFRTATAAPHRLLVSGALNV